MVLQPTAITRIKSKAQAGQLQTNINDYLSPKLKHKKRSRSKFC